MQINIFNQFIILKLARQDKENYNKAMLNKKLKYLQVALNSTLEDAEIIISQLPLDQRIILEAGTPLIKNYGAQGIEMIRNWWARKILSENYLKPLIRNFSKPGLRPAITPYIVADMKCQDRGLTEVEISKKAGANAITVNGNAPIETINALIEESKKAGLDSMIDMMNVDQPIKIMRALKNLPTVVILHRGVDEESFDRDTPVPFNQINKLRASYDVMIAIAGGDTIRDVQRAIFNDANIVVVWKDFYKSSETTTDLAKDFLKQIK